MEGLIPQSASIPKKSQTTARLVLGGILVIALIAGASLCVSKPSTFLSQYDLELQEFESFALFHRKQYSSQQEYEYRFKVYKDNSALIRLHNSIYKDLILAVNHFADLTHDEFKEMYLSEIELEEYEPKAENFENLENLGSPPSYWDWRDQGAVTDVKNQKPTCAAGWAFAAVGAIEGYLWNKTGNLYDLSVQQVVDCVNPQDYNNGCYGSHTPSQAFSYVQSNNITTDITYPYTASNNTCNTAVATSNNVTTIIGYTNVTARNLGALIAAVYTQPVVSAVEADQYVWQFYSQGVINKFCGSNVNHYVLVVGYNFTIGSNYYIAKNSWGPQWGESGYVRIAQTASTGTCGIQTYSSYPILSSS